VDAALVGPCSVRMEWSIGGLTLQDLLDAFQVKREPVDEPGVSSLYRIEVMGTDLVHARESLPDFAYRGPLRISPNRSYNLAIQKPQAFHQTEYFGREIGGYPPEPVAELWEAAASFGRARAPAGLTLDASPSESSDSKLAAILRPPIDLKRRRQKVGVYGSEQGGRSAPPGCFTGLTGSDPAFSPRCGLGRGIVWRGFVAGPFLWPSGLEPPAILPASLRHRTPPCVIIFRACSQGPAGPWETLDPLQPRT